MSLIRRLSVLLLCLLLAFSPGTCLAAEITDQELNQSIDNLTQLLKNNQATQTNLTIWLESLKKVDLNFQNFDARFEKLDKNWLMFENRLMRLEQDSRQMSSLYKELSVSFKELEKETKKRETENLILKVIIGALVLRK